ncbi:DUF91 domain-containing protein (plasmid) [Azospirillum humicireducens]|uniref:DUF91 domain-containing protein n=1 Tax=Azospirillum humicireducens TaxID=1226968 RepID=A0A2R4VVH9_9PROT|nr:endonuclease NucS domain-containing protein [Azospirillum humicireducens]AWB08422.1 DUF91 domain-containing protein [Azospirillum humicireducens]
MKPEYKAWLELEKYAPNTVNAQLYRAERVEDHHGNLDEHYAKDRMESLLSTLRYSKDDKRRNHPNPSKLPIDGDLQTGLAAYRGAVERYRRFRDTGYDDMETLKLEEAAAVTVMEDVGRSFGLERDMQAALRSGIEQLEQGLTIIDDGAERSVQSGFIDITARDVQGRTVIIELKAGTARHQAVAQIASYMGDVLVEEGGEVRGILVASGFDAKTKAAARVIPTLTLRQYSFKFLFSEVED